MSQSISARSIAPTVVKRRNHTFDFLCALCIVRMVCLHVFQVTGFVGAHWWKEVMLWTFYLMSFFFFKAGYFNKSVSGPTPHVIKDRSKRLLLPYLTCGLIGNALFWLFMLLLEGEYARNPVRFLWIHVYRVSDFYGNPPMWFLFTFYMMYLSVHFIEKLRRPLDRPRTTFRALEYISIIVIFFPAISYWLYRRGNPLWMSLNNLPMAIFFFYLGHWWRLLLERIPRRVMLALSAGLVAGFVAGNIFFHGEYTIHTNDFLLNPWGAVLNMVLIVCGLSGLLISLRLPRIPVLNYIGQHSMVFFVLHFPIIYTYRNIARLMHVSLRASVLDSLLMLALVFVLCRLITPYFERVPWLSGRWKK